MAVGDFNEESEKPEFIYRQNPLSPRAYLVCQYNEDIRDYVPVGDYTVLDLSEPKDLSDKRIANFMSSLNKKKRNIDLSSLTNTRILFTIIPRKPEDTHQKVVFRTYDGAGVSKENAILVIEKDVFDEYD
jgi:hypothetical protein